MENKKAFRVTELIRKKRDCEELEDEEVEAFVRGVANGDISPAQTGAMLMAIYLQKLSEQETVALTRAMVKSGETLCWPKHWAGLLVDKHSTGGVGDKISIPLAPALAACGLKAAMNLFQTPMISGRGLGYTGGTLDKLESIPGFNVSQSCEAIRHQVETVGACIVGQTQSLAPADKVIYATRDTTATVDNMSLMAASIISKKAAENIDALVLEVTVGSASPFVKIEDARKLASILIKLGNGLGIKTSAMVVRMDDPIGYMIGNSLEIIESLQCLNGEGPPDLEQCVCQMGAQLLVDSGKAKTMEEGADIILGKLRDGSAKRKFLDMMVAQGVDPTVATSLTEDYTKAPSILPCTKHTTDFKSSDTGYVHQVDALTCGKLAHELGAGRYKPGEDINYAVGVQLRAHVGAHLKQGDVWATVHHESPNLTAEQVAFFEKALILKDHPPKPEDTRRVLEILHSTT